MNAQETVEQIYQAEREKIYSYLVQLAISPAHAQEITQEAFLKLYLELNKGDDPIHNPRAWLYRVAHNMALRSRGREARFAPFDPDSTPVDTTPDPERKLLERARRAALQRAVSDLSPQQRNCLHLRVQGLRYREIGEVLGISSSAVGEFLRRAAIRLKEAVHG